MASAARPRSSELNVRVRDYLDDKLQVPTDFEGLDELLQQARNQQGLLKKQLQEANSRLEEATDALHGHETGVREKLEVFHEQQTDIDRQLLTITEAKTSDDAVQTFEPSMAKLRRLDVATGYLQLLQEVEYLRKQAQESCKRSTRAALPAYTQLQSLVKALQDAQLAAEGGAPHLVDHVEQQTSKVYAQLKEAASADLTKTLDQVGWPKKDLQIDSRTGARLTEQVSVLLDLQEPDLKSHFLKLQDELSTTETVVLLPFDVIVHPLRLRFRYHFYGNRPTSRLDKPEYFLSHILDLLEDHNAFLLEYIQPILDARSRSLPDLDGMYPDVTSAFVSALLPMVEAKVLALLPQIRSQGQLLSHFMHELMSFDTTLRDSWAFTPVPQSLSDWKGLTWTVLVTHNYFNTWLTVEKDFALARYQSIISTPDGGDIDFESTESGTTKPTKSALRVNDLLETITDRYKSLSSFSQKLRFLIEIQLEIFDQYHQRLYGSLERYVIDTSTLGKVIQGSSGSSNEPRNKSDVHGMYGLESLCKVFGNAEYLERKMSDWSDDIFFLELWDELQDRARRNHGTNGSVGRDLTTSEVALRTSATINPEKEGNNTEADEGALFDETASAFRRLRFKAEEQINDLLIKAITTSLRPYSKVSGWSSLSFNDVSTATTNSSMAPTSMLEPALQLVSDFLSFLFKVLARAPLRRIAHHLCLAMQKYIWDNVLMRNTFSASGTQQLRTDVDAIKTVVDSCIKYPGDAGRGMRRLDEGTRLLGLPIKPSEGSMLPRIVAAEDEEGWGFDDADDDHAQASSGADPGIHRDSTMEYIDDNTDKDKAWSLWEVEKRVFSSNESARSVLADMGIETLNEPDARALLGRRVEVGS